MKCFTCGKTMIDLDNYLQATVRVFRLYCPKCGSTTEVHFHPIDRSIIKVIWNREEGDKR